MQIETLPLFVREDVDLSDYVPKFSREESCFFYSSETYQVRHGFGYYDEDDAGKLYTRHMIIVNGEKIESSKDTTSFYGAKDVFDKALCILNERFKIEGYTIDYKPYVNKPKQDSASFIWLKENFKDIIQSINYWKIVDYQEMIDKKKSQIKKLEEDIRISKIVSNVEKLAIKEGRLLKQDEFDLLCLEFGMLKSELNKFKGAN